MAARCRRIGLPSCLTDPQGRPLWCTLHRAVSPNVGQAPGLRRPLPPPRRLGLRPLWRTLQRAASTFKSMPGSSAPGVRATITAYSLWRGATPRPRATGNDQAPRRNLALSSASTIAPPRRPARLDSLCMTEKAGVVIEKDGHGFYAWCPELKGCQSQGATLEEAIASIKEEGSGTTTPLHPPMQAGRAVGIAHTCSALDTALGRSP